MSVDAPAVRVRAGGRKFSIAMIWGLVLVGAWAFAMSAEALVAIAAEIGLSPVVRFGAPVVVDAAIVVLASSIAGFHARGDKAPVVTVGLEFSLVAWSVVVNVWHASLHTDNLIALGFAGWIPVTLFGCTYTVRRYLFDTRKVRAPRTPRVAAAVPAVQASLPSAASTATSHDRTESKTGGPEVAEATAARPPVGGPSASTRARVFELHLEGKTNAEIAEIVGIDRSGVSRHLSKAKAERQSEPVAA